MRTTIDEEGETRVRERFVVSAPVAGRVLRIELEPGDRVRRGETVLATFLPAAPAPLDVRTRAEAEAARGNGRNGRLQIRILRRFQKHRNVIRTVRKISVHLKDEFIVALQCPREPRTIGPPQTVLLPAMQDMNHRIFRGLLVRHTPRAVG